MSNFQATVGELRAFDSWCRDNGDLVTKLVFHWEAGNALLDDPEDFPPNDDEVVSIRPVCLEAAKKFPDQISGIPTPWAGDGLVDFHQLFVLWRNEQSHLVTFKVRGPKDRKGEVVAHLEDLGYWVEEG